MRSNFEHGGAAWKETISERFEPSEVFVPLGSDVTWTNEDDLAHTINSGMKGYGLYEYIQNGTSNSGKLNKRESFSFHFDKLGTYEYFCIPHPWMSGAIIVE
jgi:plastocyanin